MKLFFNSLVVWSVLVFVSGSYAAEVAITKVGNGDAGGDLERTREVTDGRLIKTRDQAIRRLKMLHIEGVEGLGNLLPELQSSQILLSSQAVEATLLQDAPAHRSSAGQVYARTFADSHAATRFFPEALGLNDEQLVALHIHEALHRALPATHRESESVVSEITLAIVSPDVSHDRVRATTGRLLALSPQLIAADEMRTRQAAPAQVSVAIKPEGVDNEDWVLDKPNLFFAEGLGKGLTYSLGYERQVSARVSLGIGFSLMKINPPTRTQQELDASWGVVGILDDFLPNLFSTFSVPLYVHYSFLTGRHRPFIEAGAALFDFYRMHIWAISPQFGAGYEFRTQTGFFVRGTAYLMAMIPLSQPTGYQAPTGFLPFVPTLGLSLGWAF